MELPYLADHGGIFLARGVALLYTSHSFSLISPVLQIGTDFPAIYGILDAHGAWHCALIPVYFMISQMGYILR